MNYSAWSSGTIKNLSYNFYFDIIQVIEAIYTFNDITTRIGMDKHANDEGKATKSKLIQYKGNIYYIKIIFPDGTVVMPIGQSEYRYEYLFRIAFPDGSKVLGIQEMIIQ